MNPARDLGEGNSRQRREPNVGGRIRSLREWRRLSLRALAELSGLSTNAISLIERGENSPTVSSLHLLSTALEVPMTSFFEDEHEQTAVFISRGRRLRSQSDGLVMESLGIGLRDQQLAPFIVTVQPGAGNDDSPVSHSGEELVYCLEGQIDYHVGGEAYRLDPGDSLLFEANQSHTMANPGAKPSSLILVFQIAGGASPAGEHHLGREVGGAVESET